MRQYFAKAGTSEGALLAWESRKRTDAKPEVDPYQGGRGGWAAHKNSRELLSKLPPAEQVKAHLNSNGFFSPQPDPDKYREKARVNHREAMLAAVERTPPEALDGRVVPTLMETQAVVDAYEREKGGPPSAGNDWDARGAVKKMSEEEDSLHFRGKPQIEAQVELFSHTLSRANGITDWKAALNLALAYDKHGGKSFGDSFRNRAALLYSKEHGFNPGRKPKAEKALYFPNVNKEDSQMDQKKVDELRREVVRMVTSGEKPKKSSYFPDVNKAGTSEGARLAWESRRRAEGKRDEYGAKIVPVDPKKLQAQAKREGAALPSQRAHIQDLVSQAIHAQAAAKPAPAAKKPEPLVSAGEMAAAFPTTLPTDRPEGNHKVVRENLPKLSPANQVAAKLSASGHNATDFHAKTLIEAAQRTPPEKIDGRVVSSSQEDSAMYKAAHREFGGKWPAKYNKPAQAELDLWGKDEGRLAREAKPGVDPKLEARTLAISRTIEQANKITDWKEAYGRAAALEDINGHGQANVLYERAALLYSKEHGFDPVIGGAEKPTPEKPAPVEAKPEAPSPSPKVGIPSSPVTLPGGTKVPAELHDLARKVIGWANSATGASAGAAGAYAGSLLRDPMSSESNHAVHVQLLYIRSNMAGWKGVEGRAARQEMAQHIKDFEAKAYKSADSDATDLFRSAMPKWVSPCSRVAAPNPKSKRPL